MSSMPPKHARGTLGEQSMGFYLGERGYFFVDGPSGSKEGFGVTAKGFDGVAFNPKSHHLIIYDNKAFAASGNVYEATAITSNLMKNLHDTIGRVQQLTDMPGQAEILELLWRTKSAILTKTALPSNVSIAISNAGGRASGVGPKLSQLGITFIDYYQAPHGWRRVVSNQDIAILGAQALAGLLQWIGDIGIQREINRRLQNELAPRIQGILAQGRGVLVVIQLQEDAIADDNDRRGRMLLGVYVQGGDTQAGAQANWESASNLLPGAGAGWQFVTRYGWIPPLTGFHP